MSVQNINGIWVPNINFNNEKQILHYIYSGNTVLTPTAIDMVSGNITVSEDTSTINQNNFYRCSTVYTNMVSNPYTPDSTVMPKEFSSRQNSGLSFIDAHTVNFGVVPTSSGNISAWHFESGVSMGIDNVLEPYKNYRVDITYAGPNYTIELLGNSFANATGTYYANNSNSVRWGRNSSHYYGDFYVKSASNGNIRGTINLYIKNIDNKSCLITTNGYYTGMNGTTTQDIVDGENAVYCNTSYLSGLHFNCGRGVTFSNGSIIDVYEVLS